MTLSALENQERSRRTGRPTISVLCGSVSVGLAEWNRWCREHQRPCLVTHTVTQDQWQHDFVSAFLDECEPLKTAEEYLSQRLPECFRRADFSQKSAHEIQLLCESAALESTGSDRLCCELLLAQSHHRQVGADDVCRWLSDPKNPSPTASTVIAAIIDFLPLGQSPAMLISPQSNFEFEEVDLIGCLRLVAASLAELVTNIPTLTIGLCISTNDFKRYLLETPESFSKAVLRESVIATRALSAGDVTELLRQQIGERASIYQSAIDQLASLGASEDLVARFVDAVVEQETRRSSHVSESNNPTETSSSAESIRSDQASTLRAIDEEFEQSGARSAAEIFLFTIFEATPDLTGLFELNGQPGFSFGNRPAEIDLVCISKRIALEIDGYHHFTNSAAYRRDRRKDALLQQHGYYVLRFLADDVVSDLETICEAVRHAIHWRNQLTKTSQGDTNA